MQMGLWEWMKANKDPAFFSSFVLYLFVPEGGGEPVIQRGLVGPDPQLWAHTSRTTSQCPTFKLNYQTCPPVGFGLWLRLALQHRPPPGELTATPKWRAAFMGDRAIVRARAARKNETEAGRAHAKAEAEIACRLPAEHGD